MIVFESEKHKTKMKFYPNEDGDYYIELSQNGEESYAPCIELDAEEVKIFIESLSNYLGQSFKVEE
jgi:hypothetical protein